MRLTDFRNTQLTEMASFRWSSQTKDGKELRFFGTRRSTIPTTVVIAEDGNLIDASYFTVVTTRPKAGDQLSADLMRQAQQMDPSEHHAFAQSVEGFFIGVWREISRGVPYHEMDVLLDPYPKVFKVVRNIPRPKLFQMLSTMGMQKYTFEKLLGTAPDEEMSAEHGEKLHNAVIYFPDEMRPARKKMFVGFLSDTHDTLVRNGLGELFAGQIVFAPIGKRAGDWHELTKQMRINPATKENKNNFYTLLHEYGHKFWHAFLPEEKQNRVHEMFVNLQRAGERNQSEWEGLKAVFAAADQAIKPGVQVRYVGRGRKLRGTWEITQVLPTVDKRGIKTTKYTAEKVPEKNEYIPRYSKPLVHGLTGGLLDRKNWKLLNVADAENLPDLEDSTTMRADRKSDQWFPTKYSETKSTEWWAEMFAFHMLGNLEGKPKEWMDDILGRGMNESRMDELVDVQSPAFKKWFRNSKVTDMAHIGRLGQGKPMMVFHGTKSPHEFTALRGGTHFGTPGQAETFAAMSGGDRPRTGPGRIYPVYLRIENPVEMWDSVTSHGDEPDAYLRDILTQAEYDDDFRLEQRLKMWAQAVNWDKIPDERKFARLITFLKKLGYDGIVYMNRKEDQGYNSWIPFSQKQIKYAYAESITEDAEDDAILFATWLVKIGDELVEYLKQTKNPHLQGIAQVIRQVRSLRYQFGGNRASFGYLVRDMVERTGGEYMDAAGWTWLLKAYTHNTKKPLSLQVQAPPGEPEWNDEDGDGDYDELPVEEELEIYEIAAETPLYHGTQAPLHIWDEREESPDMPFWVSDPNVAKKFATWNEWGGNEVPRIISYKAARPLKLLLIQGTDAFEELEDMGIDTSNPNEMAEGVCAKGYDGWMIPDNYQPGHDIMICDADALEYTGTKRLEEPSVGGWEGQTL